MWAMRHRDCCKKDLGKWKSDSRRTEKYGIDYIRSALTSLKYDYCKTCL